MNIKLLTVCMALLLGSASAYAETTSADVAEEWHEFSSSLRDYTVDQRDQAVEESHQALAALDKKIDALQQKIKNVTSDKAAEKDKKDLFSLKTERKKLAKLADKLESSSKKNWNALRDQVSDTYDDIADSIDDSVDAVKDKMDD